MQTQSHFAKQLIWSGVVLGVVLLLGLLLVGWHKPDEETSSAPGDTNKVSVSAFGQKVANIETSPVRLETLSQQLRATGQVVYSPDQTVKIAPRLTGRVRQVLVKVGDPVKAGSILAVMESVDAATAQNTALENDNKQSLAKTALGVAEQQYKLGTPEVTSALAVLRQAQESERAARILYEKGQLQDKIGGFTQKPLEDATNAFVSAQSALSQAQSDLVLAQKDLDRKKKLVEIGVVATADLEVSQDGFDKAEETVKADQQALDLAKEALDRERKAYKSNLYSDQQVEQLRTAYNQAVVQRTAAERALAIVRAAILQDLRNARSAYDLAHFDSVNAHHALDMLGRPSADGSLAIRSPISGIITERDVNPGQVLDQSTLASWQMFVISNPNPIWVDTDVFEKDVASVPMGGSINITVPALPGHQFTGRILRIAPIVDKTARSVKVRSEIPNPSDELKDGEFADVTIWLSRPRRVLLIPLSGVLHDGDKDYVYLQNGKEYDKQLVELGSIEGDDVEVVGGLHEGQHVVKHGALFLGSEVNGD